MGKSKTRQPKRRRRAVSTRPVSTRPEDQPLFHDLRRGLRSNDPLDLLSIISGLIEATDRCSRNPFARDEPTPDLSDVVESFVETPFAETTAALIALRALISDDVMAARIGRELALRRHPMPKWLRGLREVRVESEVWFMTHVLGDGDDYFVAGTLPSGHSFTAVVYVDHNMGTVVKDGFVLPAPLDEVLAKTRDAMDDPGQSLIRVDAARARAEMAEAIDHGSRMFPPLVSESWPACRPLIEWLLRGLPDGGEVPEPHEWSPAERSAIQRRFLASEFGRAFDDVDGRSLLDSVLWFGTDWGPGDPLRWSPVNVEMLLVDWAPRKIVDETRRLAKLPDLLRAFIRFAHAEKGIRASLTTETLAAVDRWQGEYQRLIRTDRPQGAEALLASMLDSSDDDSDYLLESLDRAVGGRFQLMNLSDIPLPDEPFDWSAIPADIKPVLERTLELCDRCADELFDVEHRTAMRRFLSRAATADPAIFRRKAPVERGAAAIAWVICSANGTLGAHRERMKSSDLMAWFGVKGTVSQRAQPLLFANGINPHDRYGSMDLETPDLLTSERRRRIIEVRDGLSND